MKHAVLLSWMVVLGASAVGLVLAGREAVRARLCAKDAVAQLASVSRQAQELATLRSVAPRAQRRPGSGLAPRVAAALARSGLPASAMSSLSPDSVAGAGTQARRQRATLTLGSVTLPQVGVFLNAWRAAEPAWVIASVDLAPLGAGTPGADLPLRTVIGLEAVYVEESGPAPNGGLERAGGDR